MVEVLYLILLGFAIFLLLVDAFAGANDVSNRGNRFTVKLLPFALALVVLVEFIRTAKRL